MTPKAPRGNRDHWVPTVLQPECCSWSSPPESPALTPQCVFGYSLVSSSHPFQCCFAFCYPLVICWTEMGFWGVGLVTQLFGARSAGERGSSKHKLQNCWTPQSSADPPWFPSQAVLSRRVTTIKAWQCSSGTALLFVVLERFGKVHSSPPVFACA